MKKWRFVRHAMLAGMLLCGGLLGGGIASAEAPMASAANAGYSAPTLYNLGNEAARAGNTALAVLYYERARLLAPNDADLLANLAFVRQSGGVPQQPAGWLARHGSPAAPNAMYWVGILGLLLGGGSLLALRLRVPRRKMLAAAAIVGAVMTALSVGDAVATMPSLSEAVVMHASPASASPVAGAEAQFTVPAAEVVHILDRHGGFLLIRDTQAREGWISGDDVVRVIPPRGAPGG